MIDQRLKEQLYTVGQFHNVNKIILFGSRAIRDNTEKSDIDLAFVAPEMSDKEWIKFSDWIGEELDTLLLLDLIKFEDASDELKNEIIKYGKAIYSRNSHYNKIKHS